MRTLLERKYLRISQNSVADKQRWFDCNAKCLIVGLLWDQTLSFLNNRDLTNQLRQDQAA